MNAGEKTKIFREAAAVTGRSEAALRQMAESAFCWVLYHALRNRGSVMAVLCRIAKKTGRLEAQVHYRVGARDCFVDLRRVR